MVLLTRMLTARRMATAVAALGLSAVAMAQLRPAELVARVASAGLTGPILRFCPATFRPGRSGFAIAMPSSESGKGRYFALDGDAPPVVLGGYVGEVDLACYDRQQADQLNTAIRESGGAMHGQVAPRWDTTIVCGFAESTLAVCWQLDPEVQRFVEVGRWTT